MYISVPSPEGTNLPDEEIYLKLFTTKMCQLPTTSGQVDETAKLNESKLVSGIN